MPREGRGRRPVASDAWLAGGPGLEILFFLQLRRDRFRFTAGREFADADPVDRRSSVDRRQHVRRVALGAQPPRDRVRFAAQVQGGDLHGEAGTAWFGRGGRCLFFRLDWRGLRRRRRDFVRRRRACWRNVAIGRRLQLLRRRLLILETFEIGQIVFVGGWRRRRGR